MPFEPTFRYSSTVSYVCTTVRYSSTVSAVCMPIIEQIDTAVRFTVSVVCITYRYSSTVSDVCTTVKYSSTVSVLCIKPVPEKVVHIMIKNAYDHINDYCLRNAYQYYMHFVYNTPPINDNYLMNSKYILKSLRL